MEQLRSLNMIFSLRDIPNAVIEKSISVPKCVESDYVKRVTEAYNIAIEKQYSVKFRLKREKLASVLYTAKGGNYHVLSDTDKVLIMGDCYREADAIIASSKDLIEVVHE